jgi:TPM domain
MFNRFFTLFKHRWLDVSDSRKTLPDDLLNRLKKRVAASEHRHSGEIRICIEAGLPTSYLWRHFWHKASIRAVMRQRAIMMFSKLRIWDTEHNNGVLIYLLLAERDIELVADRGINQYVDPAEWVAIVQRLSKALHEDRFEDGLTQALEEVSAILMRHFELQTGDKNPNELPNAPFVA